MRTTAYYVLLSLFILPAASSASSTTCVISDGSHLQNPPQFWNNSFLVGLSGSWQEAHPFHVIPGNEWLPERLEIPLYHYQGMAGNSATFSIWTDVAGKPGSPLATFPVSNITTEQRVLSIAPSFVASPLQGDANYWLVGVNTGGGQVNWNMEASTGDYTRAYRVNGGDWVVQSHLANQSAFAVMGSPVPEPSSFILFSIGGLISLAYAWQCRSAHRVARQ